jgi:hypothetical protein
MNHIHLQCQLKAYSKADPPTHGVKPIPVPIITHAATLCCMANTTQSNTIADMLLLGFFFLLRPKEYAATDNPDACPFCLCNVNLLRGSTHLNSFTSPEHDLRSATTVALEFSNQKNGVRGELVGLGQSGHPLWCPVQTILNRLLHFRLHQAPAITPLYFYWDGGSWRAISSTTITHHLCLATTMLGAAHGITKEDISIGSLLASGAMALLCTAVDTDIICLLGRWWSDEMLHYLHAQALPIFAPMASQMHHHGHFALIPNNRLSNWG